MNKSKPRRQFSPQQKADIVRSIQSSPTIQAGLDKFDITSSLYYKWSRQLEVGINASLRNSKPIKPIELRQLEKENLQLKEIILNLTVELTTAKKSLSLGI